MSCISIVRGPDGTLDSRYNNSLGNGYYQDNVFRSLLSSWYATSATIYDTKEIGIIIIYYYYFVAIKKNPEIHYFS